MRSGSRSGPHGGAIRVEVRARSGPHGGLGTVRSVSMWVTKLRGRGSGMGARGVSMPILTSTRRVVLSDRFTAHTAVVLPNVPAGAPRRESCEVTSTKGWG